MSLDAGDANNDGHLEAEPRHAAHSSYARRLNTPGSPLNYRRRPIRHRPTATCRRSRRQPASTANGASSGESDASGWSWSSKFGDLTRQFAGRQYRQRHDRRGVVRASAGRRVGGGEPSVPQRPGNQFRTRSRNWALEARESDPHDQRRSWTRTVTWTSSSTTWPDRRGCSRTACAPATTRRWTCVGRPPTVTRSAHRSNWTPRPASTCAAGGHLSGDAPRVHFGVPPRSQLRASRIVWRWSWPATASPSTAPHRDSSRRTPCSPSST